jgi:hypothetical protein
MVWQFLDADGDIPGRAVQKVIEPKLRIPAATSFEVEVTRRDKRMVELDFCASRNGRLYICEAKLQDRLDSSAKGEEERLAKLKKAATILRADVVVLATGKAAWRNATLNRARSAFPGEWPLLVPTSGARPVA